MLNVLLETSLGLLQNTFYIKLNFGQYSEFGNSSALYHFKSLRWLQINNQGIHSLLSHFLNGPLVNKLDLSNNIISRLQAQAFGNLHSIEILNLDDNRISHLANHFCESLSRLKFLYLINNPLWNIDPGILINSHSIQAIRSDWYMLCCVVHNVKDCKPIAYLVSSCDSLLSHITAKVAITGQGAFALLINGAILLTFLISKHRSPDFPLMISLVFADFIMGVYLIIITVTDLSTSGSFYLYIAQWTQSNTCIIAGMLNFVSSEASLCILAAIGVIRAVAIQKVGGLKTMGNQIVCATVFAWGLVTVFGAVYAFAYWFGELHLRNNIVLDSWSV